MDHVKSVLEQFGQHTRQSDTELLDTSKIAQKYVALHIGGMVPTEFVYDCVSNDYNAVGLRTHNPPLKTYAQHGKIDVPTFIQAMQSISRPLSTAAPVFSQFQRRFFSKPKDQEKWAWLERPNQWKEAAAYVAMTMHTSPKFGELVDQLALPSNVDRQNLTEFLKQNKDKVAQIATEVGTLLKQIQMQDNLFLGTPIPVQSALVVDGAYKTSSSPLNAGLITLNKKGSTSSKTSLRSLRERMEPYRQRAGLNKTFKTEKLAKQIMISALNVPDHTVPTAILGSHQRSVAPLETDDERELASTLVDVFEKEPDFDPNKSARCQALSKATLSNMWEPRSMLKNILHSASNIENGRHLKAYVQSGVDGLEDAELTRAIEQL